MTTADRPARRGGVPTRVRWERWLPGGYSARAFGQRLRAFESARGWIADVQTDSWRHYSRPYASVAGAKRAAVSMARRLAGAR